MENSISKLASNHISITVKLNKKNLISELDKLCKGFGHKTVRTLLDTCIKDINKNKKMVDLIFDEKYEELAKLIFEKRGAVIGGIFKI